MLGAGQVLGMEEDEQDPGVLVCMQGAAASASWVRVPRVALQLSVGTCAPVQHWPGLKDWVQARGGEMGTRCPREQLGAPL